MRFGWENVGRGESSLFFLQLLLSFLLDFFYSDVVLPSICLLFSSDFILECAFFLPSLTLSLFPYYYHLNINVVGYNSVGFIILYTERTARTLTGHLYHSLIYYARVCVYVFVLAEQFYYWLALKFSNVHCACSCIHTNSNYSSEQKCRKHFRGKKNQR